MKRATPLIIILFFLAFRALPQEKETKGKAIAELFTDFHHIVAGDSVSTGFNVSRAYLGYSFIYNNLFTGTIIIDAGNPADLAAGSMPRRYAHYREASLTYTGDKLTLAMGITGTKIFAFQQKFWGKRYVANTYQSLYGYGYSADIGIVATYKFNQIVEADITVMNGEGYYSLQLDNDIRVSAGLSVTPTDRVALRFYGDIQKKEGLVQNTLIGFAGYRSPLFYIGSEITYKSNLDLTEGHHAWGTSTTAGVTVFDKTEIFARYDLGNSVVPEDEDLRWNFHKDGTLIIAGVQYEFNTAVKIALNYKTFLPADNDLNRSNGVYLNALFKF